jgi:ABC-type Mn2+/Zn2+ transport system permease subunit
VSLGAWTILVAAVGNVSCALVGCYLVLRRLSLLGDAISHAVLPGIALAFLLTGRLTGPAIVVGAMLVGVLTTLLTEAIHKVGDVPEDSSMGVVFTALFAAGVLLISSLARHVDLDPGCVLYGQIELVPLDRVEVLGLSVPRALLTLVPVLLATVAFVVLLWKELKLAAFDPELATAMGFSAGFLHYLLMAWVAGVTVASFEAVGAILVVAMLIVPAATAHLLTDRLGWMMVVASLVAILASVLGYWVASALKTNVAGMMAVAAGGLFTLAVFLGPRHGVLARLLRNLGLALRIAREDVLGELYRRQEAIERGETTEAGLPLEVARARAGGWIGGLAVRSLRWAGLVEEKEGKLVPTAEGLARGRFLVRSHRLWETYLEQNIPLPLDHLHDPAERMEHFIDPELQAELEAELDRKVDPHGRKIPPGQAP